MYTATAVLPSGESLTVNGTLQQCSNWADNIIRTYGECEITVRQEGAQ